MIHNISKYMKGCLCGLAALAFVSCSDDEDSTLDSAIVPSSIEFKLPENLSRLIYTDATGAKCLPMLKGETATLGYTMQPDDATYKDVVWTSTNEAVATVDDEGTVSAISGSGTGYSMVQVAPLGVYDGSGINDVLKVVVSDVMIPATSIAVKSSSDELYGGDTLHLSAVIAPDNSTYKTVSWSTSDESIGTVSSDGVLTTNDISAFEENLVVTATALDGSGVAAQKTVLVKKRVVPEKVTIDQTYSVDNGYYCALNEQSVTLAYTTVPAQSTTSLLKWTSSDESIATVDNGVVTFNKNGRFGDVTITATCPETGNSSSVKLNLACGLIRETFHNPDHYSFYNAAQSGNGTSSSHEWHDGYITITTYTQNATNQRADIKCYDTPVYLHAGNYPIVAVKVDDVADMNYGITSRNFNFDVVGTSQSGTNYSALGNGNNKFTNDYKCSDGSHVLIYDLRTLQFGTGGLAPANEYISFSIFQLKYADMKTVDHQVTYNLYWFQTFKSLEAVGEYIHNEGLTYDVIK